MAKAFCLNSFNLHEMDWQYDFDNIVWFYYKLLSKQEEKV